MFMVCCCCRILSRAYIRVLGKRQPGYWAAVVKPGHILFEIDGVPLEVAQEALRLAAQKLPVKTKFITRNDYEA